MSRLKESILEFIILMIILVPSMTVYYVIFGNPVDMFHSWNDLLSVWFLGVMIVVMSSIALRGYIIKSLKGISNAP